MVRWTTKLKPFFPYLEDLRRRLYATVVLFCILFGVGIFASRWVIAYLLIFFHIKGVTVATTSPFQLAGLAVDVGFLLATCITLPVCMFLLYQFVSPAITPRERWAIILSVPVSILLFVFGAGYGFLILYYSLDALALFNQSLGLANIWDIGSFISEVLVTSLLLGLVFQFPLIMSALLRVGLIDTAFLRRHRREAYFAIVIFVALLPPTDGLSLLIMTAPLLLLYEVVLLTHY